MFIEINDTDFVNLEHTEMIYLSPQENECHLVFKTVSGDYLHKSFKTEKEALEWFTTFIKPSLIDYNYAKYDV